MNQQEPMSKSKSDFEEVLRAQGVKLKRENKIIQRIINNVHCGKIIKNNPQRKYHRDRPSLDALEHYSNSQYSVDFEQEKPHTPIHTLPRTIKHYRYQQNQHKMPQTRDAILADRAKKFINRIKKQKQYQEGRAIMRRKKEEEIKKQKEMKRKEEIERIKDEVRLERYRKIMDNILYHQERIGYRLKRSFKDYQKLSIRSKTQGSEVISNNAISRSAIFGEESKDKRSESRMAELPSLVNLKKRLAVVAKMVDSLQ